MREWEPRRGGTVGSQLVQKSFAKESGGRRWSPAEDKQASGHFVGDTGGQDEEGLSATRGKKGKWLTVYSGSETPLPLSLLGLLPPDTRTRRNKQGSRGYPKQRMSSWWWCWGPHLIHSGSSDAAALCRYGGFCIPSTRVFFWGGEVSVGVQVYSCLLHG